MDMNRGVPPGQRVHAGAGAQAHCRQDASEEVLWRPQEEPHRRCAGYAGQHRARACASGSLQLQDEGDCAGSEFV